MKIFRFVLDLVSIILLGIVDIVLVIGILIGYEKTYLVNGLALIVICVVIAYAIILLGKDISNILDLKNEDNK